MDGTLGRTKTSPLPPPDEAKMTEAPNSRVSIKSCVVHSTALNDRDLVANAFLTERLGQQAQGEGLARGAGAV